MVVSLEQLCAQKMLIDIWLFEACDFVVLCVVSIIT